MLLCPKCNEPAPEGVDRCPHDGTPLAGKGRTGTRLAATPPPASKTPVPGSSGVGQTRASTNSRLEDYLAEESVEIAVGTMIGEYEVTGKLGEGGMGEVYGAVHPVIGKKVAIKVLAEHVASNREVVRRFVAEARAVNQIGHRNIVDVFSFGQLQDGREYFVMEHLAGRSLEDELELRPRLETEEIVVLMEQVLDALQAAHEKSIIHRDLKPDNIFLVDTRRGREAKLLDFGIAKLSGDEATLTKTRTGVAMGTPDYMSPEQCRGAKVDHRTDIYALGVILYRLFTGRFPFDAGTPMELFVMHMHNEPPPPSSIHPISAAFEAIILKCLAKNMEERFATAAELLDALSEAMANPGEVLEGSDVTMAAPAAKAPEGEKSLSSAEIRAVGAADTQPPAPTATVAAAKPKRNLVPILLVAIGMSGAGLGALVLMTGNKKGNSKPVVAATVDAAPVAAISPADAAPPSPPDAALAPKKASLRIKTNLADAEVLVDGELKGKGRVVEIGDLPAGTYVVQVRRKRYDSKTQSIKLEPGAVVSEAFILEKTRRISGKKPGGKRPDGKKPDGKKPDGRKPDGKKPLKDKDGTINVFDR